MGLELRLGLTLGLVNMAWLYASYYLGLHTRGPVVFQVVPGVWLVITLTGFVMALRAIRRARSGLTYAAGVRAGVAIAAVTAVVAAIAQAGYFTVVHPAWPVVMADQARDYFAAQGLPAADVQARVDEARQYFTLGNYVLQSSGAALAAGAVISAVVMIFLKKDRAGAGAMASPDPA